MALTGKLYRYASCSSRDVQLGHLTGILYLLSAVVVFAAPAFLSAPALVNGQIEFTRESNRAYRIEASTNLQTWFPVATNTETSVSRQIRVPDFGARCFYRTLARTPRFNFTIVAVNRIDLNGNNLVVDSFDSSDPFRSTAGQYDPLKRGDNGDIASNYGLTNSAGNVGIYGKVLTTDIDIIQLSIGPNGRVGSMAWHLAGNTGIQPGWWRNDLELAVPQMAAPFAVGMPPVFGVYNGAFCRYVLGDGAYALGNLRLASSEKMVVTGDASLLVTTDLTLNGSSQIVVAPGASLKLYIAAASASIGGNGIVNQAGYTTNCLIYGLPNCWRISIAGNGTFKGCIYAPQASLTLNGNGSGQDDFIGAAVVKSVTLYGHFNFHYDEALQRNGPFTW